MNIKVPERCLLCGAEWIGGHEFPKREMKPGLRVFYGCGGSLSIKEKLEYGFILLCKCPVQDQIEDCPHDEDTWINAINGRCVVCGERKNGH